MLLFGSGGPPIPVIQFMARNARCHAPDAFFTPESNEFVPALTGFVTFGESNRPFGVSLPADAALNVGSFREHFYAQV